jgi:hypothetical protein
MPIDISGFKKKSERNKIDISGFRKKRKDVTPIEQDEYAEALEPTSEVGSIVDTTLETIPFYTAAKTSAAVVRDMLLEKLGVDSEIEGDSFSEKYSSLNKRLVAKRKERAEENPILDTASKIAGTAAQIPLSGATFGTQALKAGIGSTMASSGISGALYTAGLSENSILDPKQRTALAWEAGLGGIISAATAGLLKGGGKLIANKLRKELLEKLLHQ